jgi:hypothetical protein
MVSQSKIPEDPLHAENTLKWILELEPKADVALQLAALGHDLERALPKRKVQRSHYESYEDFKTAHAHASSEILARLLEECGLDQGLISEVRKLVMRHEIGGDPRSDLLKVADSLSFFEVNLPFYYRRNGYKETLRRCLWGFRRLPPSLRIRVLTFTYSDPCLNALIKRLPHEAEASRLLHS